MIPISAHHKILDMCSRIKFSVHWHHKDNTLEYDHFKTAYKRKHQAIIRNLEWVLFHSCSLSLMSRAVTLDFALNKDPLLLCNLCISSLWIWGQKTGNTPPNTQPSVTMKWQFYETTLSAEPRNSELLFLLVTHLSNKTTTTFRKR